MFNLNDILRENIKNLTPYSTARDEFKGEAEVFLDANESPFPSAYNRYPDPHQRELKNVVSKIKDVQSNQLILGNGSDEIIDLLIRAFCEPGVDNIIAPQPTYGMYRVWSKINNIALKEPALTSDFQIDHGKLQAAIDANSKLVFLCSPNNPSGNVLETASVISLLHSFRGIVVVDEAYIEFCDNRSLTSLMEQHQNLFILQTLSKAWGLAGIRLGIGLGSKQVIEILSKIKSPYNVSTCTQKLALDALSNNRIEDKISAIKAQRKKLERYLTQLSTVKHVYPSQANFLLVKFDDAKSCYDYLQEQSIIVRDRSTLIHCENCLRITVGTEEENEKLIDTLKNYEKSTIY